MRPHITKSFKTRRITKRKISNSESWWSFHFHRLRDFSRICWNFRFRPLLIVVLPVLLRAVFFSIPAGFGRCIVFLSRIKTPQKLASEKHSKGKLVSGAWEKSSSFSLLFNNFPHQDDSRILRISPFFKDLI